MQTHNILVCLEGLGIGGVETAVINQVLKFKNLGNEVIVLAREGIYKEMLEQNGIVCVPFDYELKDNYCIEKSQKVAEIIEKYKIDQIHIHQFPCAAYVLPICLSKKIPYILFLHSGQLDVYDWFINTYPIYNYIFTILFKYAVKIVSITEAAKEYTVKKFNVPEEKYIICNNGINFDLYQYEDKDIEKINKILLFSRMSAEKIDSIKYAIDSFIAMYEENQNLELTIAGDGNKREVIEEYILSFTKKYPIKLIGPSNEIPRLINEHDMVMTMGRGIIETIAMKRLAFVLGYTGLKGIVTPENIAILQEENFTGRNKKDLTIDEAMLEISNAQYKEIVEDNYKYLYKNLNIETTIEQIQNEDLIYIEDDLALELFKEIEELKNKLQQTSEELKKQIEKSKNKPNIEVEELAKKDARIEALEKELQEVYSSKRWRYTDKISKIFH